MSELRKQAHTLPALLQVGKNGLTEEFINELSRTLKKKGLVKIRLLKSCAEKPREAAKIIAEKLGVELVSVVGGSLVFYDKSAKKQ